MRGSFPDFSTKKTRRKWIRLDKVGKGSGHHAPSSSSSARAGRNLGSRAENAGDLSALSGVAAGDFLPVPREGENAERLEPSGPFRLIFF